MNKYLFEKARVGDVVKYYPSKTLCTLYPETTGHKVYQYFNPSSSTIWRVFKVNDDKVEIISAYSVGRIFLGGEAGFRYGPKALKIFCSEFVDRKFAIKSRPLGFKEECACRIYSPLTAGRVYNNFKEPYIDTYYKEDYEWVKRNGLISFSDTVWLPSRDTVIREEEKQFAYFGVRLIDSDMSIKVATLCSANRNVVHSRPAVKNGVYPILTLRRNVKIESGNGEYLNPYRIIV